MRKLLGACCALLFALTSSAQKGNPWAASPGSAGVARDKGATRASFPKTFQLFALDQASLRSQLFQVVGNAVQHSIVISLPNADGAIEQFEVNEASNFEPALQARFPEIRAFSGRGVTDPNAMLKLSYAPNGVQAMVFRADNNSEFLEAYSQDHTVYAVFRKQRNSAASWKCETPDEQITDGLNRQVFQTPNTARSGGDIKTLRLAQSVTAEYSNYFGATSAAQVGLVLAAINATLTRCNGVYEKDLALHLNLISNSTDVIYYNAATDPYANASTGAGGTWNGQLQTTLTNVIGEANYDIGHLFGASGGGGNAGCIGCICVNNSKGKGFTSPADAIPQGDNFDIDYVVHEVGHQLGGNHTFSMSNEGTGQNKEVGSGITIMGYAGITSQDVAPHSIDIYHATSIAQIQTNLAAKTCPVTTPIVNATPVVNLGTTAYTIPISTPFALTGAATDADGDPLTYCWEQNDNASSSQTGSSSVASATKATGPNWISFSPSSTPTRIFPKLATVLAGNLISPTLPGGDAVANTEALSSVGRTLNFRLTVRDNAPYSSTAPIKVGQTQYGDVVVTVTNTSGPFSVTVPNTNLTWNAGTTQTVTWNVANTTAAPVSCANVKISLSTDGGFTWPTVLVASTPNDGSETITVPNTPTTTARIKIESVGNIFFDISNANFTISSACVTSVATQPASTSVCPNSTATFTTSGTGSSLTYQWQVSTDNGANFSNVSGATAATYSFTATASQNGSQYRCVITGCGTATTSAATLSVAASTSVTSNGTPAVICGGQATGFTVAATGTALTYQWQVSTNNGTSFSNVANGGNYSGATTPSLAISPADTLQTGFLYRCVISSPCAATVNSAQQLLTVNTPITIRSQPANAAVCAGSNTTLSVGATGTTPTYQWQLSTNNGTSFTAIPGATAATLALNNMPASANGNVYRCIVSGAASCGPVTSGNATLRVNPIPVVTLTASPYTRLYPGMSTTLTATSTPSSVTYQWTRNGTVQTGVTGTTQTVNIDMLGIYSVKVTDAIGCSARSADVEIADSASRTLYLYPNPNNGTFQVRFYNASGHVARSMRIFDSKGRLVFYKQYDITGMYDRMDVVLPMTASGVYMVVLYDAQGTKIAEGKAMVH